MGTPCYETEPDAQPPDRGDALGALRSAFDSDPRPGLLFEHGRLIAVNKAGRRILRAGPATDRLLVNIRAFLLTGVVPTNTRFLTECGEFAPEFHPSRTRSSLEPRVCTLVPLGRLAREVTALLSPRELDVVKWLSLGQTNAQIASRLGISVETARKHVANVLSKTRARTRAELVGMVLSNRVEGPLQKARG